MRGGEHRRQTQADKPYFAFLGFIFPPAQSLSQHARSIRLHTAHRLADPPARPPNRSEKSGIPQRKNPWQNRADRYFRSRPPLKNQHPRPLHLNTSNRIISLDILRGFAILLVFVNHFEPGIMPGLTQLHGPAGFLFWHIKSIGWAGVDLFFVLSGFLISGILFAELEKNRDIKLFRFWMRRGFKIWPSYFFLLAILAITQTSAFIDTSSPSQFCKTLLVHVFFFQNYLADNPNGPTWSLAVEEHFYILLPLLLLGLQGLATKLKKNLKDLIGPATLFIVLLCLGLRVMNVFHGVHPNDYMQTHFRIDALMIGVFCQYLWMTQSPAITHICSHSRSYFLLSLLLVSPAFFFNRTHPFMFSFGFLLLSIGFSFLLLTLYGGLIRKYETAWFLKSVAVVGTWSYNIYLWHYFLPKIQLLQFDWINRHLMEWLPGNYLVLGMQAALFTVFGLTFGYLATLCIEFPFLQLRNKLFPSRYKLTSNPTT
jgi:peptidoglycan/LPS O-acetylase OafA/YrhL